MCLVEFGIHVGAKVGELAVDDFESAVDLVKSGVHVGSEVGDLVIDDFKLFIYEFELADDFAKVGVDVDSHVVEVLLCGWFVHGLTVVISHSRTDGNKSEIVGGIHR